MKKFAAIIALGAMLVGLSMTSCTKQEPTSLDLESLQFKSVITGHITYVDVQKSSSSKTIMNGANISVVVKLNTVDENGLPKQVTIATISAKSDKQGAYNVNLPLAAGETYDVEVNASFEADNYLSDDDGDSQVVTCAFSGTSKKTGLIAGKKYVADIACGVIGVVSDDNFSKQEK